VFLSPVSISAFFESDRLQVKVKASKFFISAQGVELDPLQTFTLELPSQLSLADKNLVESFADVSIYALAAITFGGIGVSIFMAVSLQLIWKMLSTIQLIVHMPMLSVAFPANCSYCF